MISFDNLYHFTPKLEYLELILSEKRLRVQYCLKNFSWLEKSGFEDFSLDSQKERSEGCASSQAEKLEDTKFGIPMTCFCTFLQT